MSQFATNELVSLEKDIEFRGQLAETDLAAIDDLYEIQKCASWIQEKGFTKVCLQFPDHLLPDSSDIALKLQSILGQTVYILGDTAYESCCIDYVAAGHINADAIIHFGPTCFSRTSANVSYLNIYEKYPLRTETVKTAFYKTFGDLKGQDFTLLLDDGFIHCYDVICKLFEDQEIHIRTIEEDLSNLKDQNVVLLSNNNRKVINVNLSFKPKNLYWFDTNKMPDSIPLFQLDSKLLKRRYFLMEKIRDARTIGIVIGTLGVKNYLKVIERMKKLVEAFSKKYYIISVGKPTVAKLANLGEIDIYVMITCAMNEIYDSRDFYKPIVTPYDVEMALSVKDNINFTYDYNNYLDNLSNVDDVEPIPFETDVSLVTGKLRSNGLDIKDENSSSWATGTDSQIALKNEGIVTLSSNFGAGFLNERSWKGLEQNLGQTEVRLAEEGRKGIAQEYKNENL